MVNREVCRASRAITLRRVHRRLQDEGRLLRRTAAVRVRYEQTQLSQSAEGRRPDSGRARLLCCSRRGCAETPEQPVRRA